MSAASSARRVNFKSHVRLSVVIITWNQQAMTRRCIESLMPRLDPNLDEVILIDNGSVDGTDAMMATDFPQVVYCRLPENIGVGRARNRGLALARGRHLMTLDNDTIVVTDRIGDHVDAVFEDREVGLFGFRLDNPDRTLQYSARRYPTVLHPFISRIGLLQKFPPFAALLREHLMEDFDFEAQTGAVEVQMVMGANQVFRRDVLAMIAPYDEALFYGMEDYEFCVRVRKAGWKIVWSPRAVIIHDYQRMTRKFSMNTIRFIYSFIHVFAKHRSFWRLG